LIAGGSVSYAFVGVTTEDLTPALARHFGYSVGRGAVIATVRSHSPAADAGLRGGSGRDFYLGTEFVKGGDVIVALGGYPVRSSEDVVRIVTDALSPGQRTHITVVRHGARVQIPVTLTQRPTEA
jgi:S1-C subfamily serine protease